jgi:hypothetical protein
MARGARSRSAIAYRKGDEIIEWGKVMLRPDRWDAQYYPHVLDDAAEKT